LCDGHHFRFFKYDTSQKKIKFAIGHVPSLKECRVPIHEMIETEEPVDADTAVRKVRSTCEYLHSWFIQTYTQGVKDYWDYSLELARKEGQQGRDLTPSGTKLFTLRKVL
jgi:hypothetical protein